MENEAPQYEGDIILKWTVRVPGHTSWSDHLDEAEAHQEARRANRICRPGHRVYAVHRSGNVTGPYHEESGE